MRGVEVSKDFDVLGGVGMSLRSHIQKLPIAHLGDVCSFKSGNSLPMGEEFHDQENGSLLLKVSDLNRSENIPVITVAGLWTEDPVMKSVSCSPGAIILPKRGGAIATNKKRLLGRPASLDPNLMGVEPDKKHLDSLYLYYWFQQFDLTQITSGSAVPQLNKQDLSPLKIPLPPLEEQRRIAAILDKADGVRRKRQEAIRLTEELLRSQFLEMFGDPVTNPKGWDVVTVGDIVSDVRDGPHVSPKYSDEGIPILSTRNIRPAQLIMEDMKYVSKETYLDLVKTFRPQRGDVLLTKGGTTGYAKTVDWDWSFAIWVHIAALRPTEKIRPEFLEAALNSPNCYQQSQRYTHGIANKDLGLTRIRKIKLSLPPLALQDKYCCLRERLLKQLVPQKKSLNESNDLFNSLLQRAFRGEL